MLVVEHKTHEISGTRVKGKLIILELSLFASPAVGKTAIEIVRFTTFVVKRTICYDLDNLANGILPCHKLQGVFTGVSKCVCMLFGT